jgi:hypothetical protein
MREGKSGEADNKSVVPMREPIENKASAGALSGIPAHGVPEVPKTALKSGAWTWFAGKRLPSYLEPIVNEVMDFRAALIREECEERGTRALSVKDLWIIDQLCFKTVFLRLVDNLCMQAGPILTSELEKGRIVLQPALSASYLAFANSARLDLEALRQGKDRPVKRDYVQIVRDYVAGKAAEDPQDGEASE